MIVHSRKKQRMVGIDLVIQSQAGRTSHTLNSVLSDIKFFQYHSIFWFVPYSLYVVWTKVVVVVGTRENDSQLIICYSITDYQTTRPNRFVGKHVYPRGCSTGYTKCIWSLSSNQVYRSTNCIGIHIWKYSFVHLNGLNHIWRNQVHLHVSIVSFSRRKTLSIECNWVQLWRNASDDDVSRFALVILHGDAWNSLQCIANVGIRETANLIWRYHIGDVGIILLLVQRLCLTFQTISKDHYFLTFNRRFTHCEFNRNGLSCSHLNTLSSRSIPEVWNFYFIRSRCQIDKWKFTFLVGNRSISCSLQHYTCTWQGEILGVNHFAFKHTLCKNLCTEKQQEDKKKRELYCFFHVLVVWIVSRFKLFSC